jgi:hypothetical protein
VFLRSVYQILGVLASAYTVTEVVGVFVRLVRLLVIQNY